jgi:hypothetical protein
MNAVEFITNLSKDKRIQQDSVKKRTDEHGLQRNRWTMIMFLSVQVVIKIYAEYSNEGKTGSFVRLTIDDNEANWWQVTREQLSTIESILDTMEGTANKITNDANQCLVEKLFKEIVE